MANTALFTATFESNTVEFASEISTSMKAAQRSATKLTNQLKIQETALKHGEEAAQQMRLSLLNLEDAQLKEIATLQASIAAEYEKADALRQQKLAEDMRQKELQQSERAIDGIIMALKEEHIALNEGSNALMLHRAAQKGATLDQLAMIKSLQNKNDALKQTGKGYQEAGRGARQFSAMGGQLGHQVQDVAVQLQMGTNAAIVFAQQGSQVAAIFGARGAMLGGLFAVGAALYTFMDASSEAKKEVAKLTDALDEQIQKKKELTDAERAYLSVQYRKELIEQKKQLDILEDNHDSAVQKLNAHRAALQRIEKPSVAYSAALGQSAAMATLADHAIIKITGSTDDLTNELEQYAAQVEYVTKLEEKVAKNKDLIARGLNPALTESTEDMVKALKEQNETYGMTSEKADLYRVMTSNISDALKAEYAAQWTSLEAKKANTKKTQEAYKKNQEYVDSIYDLDKAYFDTLETYDDQLEMLGKTWAEQELIKASKKGLTEAQLEETKTVLQNIEAKKEALAIEKNLRAAEIERSNASFDKQDQAITDFDAIKDQYKTEAELLAESEQEKLDIIKNAIDTGLLFEKEAAALRKKIQDESAMNALMIQQQTDLSLAQGAQNLVNTMASAFEKSSGLGKAFYVMSQAMNAGLAIMNAEAAATATLKNATQMGMDPGTAATMANMTRMQGYISAGIIAGQTLASFEGGGYTPSGARSGGVDGKGGFLATLHPNEKITDLTKQSESQPVSVNFTINAVDSKGVDRLLAERQGMIVSMVNRAMNNNGRRGVV